MDLKQLIHDDDAVSPVIGVILMVAITVILAAVIATFVLGLGENLSNTAPQATFGFEYESVNDNGDFSSSNSGDGLLTVTHEGGDTIEAAELSIAGSSAISADTTFTNGALGSSDVTAGSSVDIRVNEVDTIRVVYTSSDGGSSATLGEWTGPGA